MGLPSKARKFYSEQNQKEAERFQVLSNHRAQRKLKISACPQNGYFCPCLCILSPDIETFSSQYDVSNTFSEQQLCRIKKTIEIQTTQQLGFILQNDQSCQLFPGSFCSFCGFITAFCCSRCWILCWMYCIYLFCPIFKWRLGSFFKKSLISMQKCSSSPRSCTSAVYWHFRIAENKEKKTVRISGSLQEGCPSKSTSAHFLCQPKALPL